MLVLTRASIASGCLHMKVHVSVVFGRLVLNTLVYSIRGLRTFGCSERRSWVLVKELNLSYHHKETLLFTIDPYFGN